MPKHTLKKYSVCNANGYLVRRSLISFIRKRSQQQLHLSFVTLAVCLNRTNINATFSTRIFCSEYSLYAKLCFTEYQLPQYLRYAIRLIKHFFYVYTRSVGRIRDSNANPRLPLGFA